MQFRRIVTGVDADGKAVVASDDQVDAVTVDLVPGGGFWRMWGTDAPVAVPNAGELQAPHAYFPPEGGYRFSYFQIGPASERQLPEDVDLGPAMAQFEERLPGMPATLDLSNPGMHTTQTVDFVVVLSGEIWLELDDGAETHLTAGDCVVQNGTAHAWRNHGREPAVMAVALIGAPAA